MKQGKSLIELAQAITAMSEQKVDLVSDTRKITMDDTGKLHVADREMVPTKNCHNQIAQRLNIPAGYYQTMLEKAPHLLSTNVNHWFQTNHERRMIRGIGGTARAFLSDRYHRIDNEHVMDTVLPVLMESGGIKVQSCEVTESRLYLKATSTSIATEVKGSKRVGDVVEAGLLITNSEVGLGSLSIKPFLHFLVCTNGMVRDKLSFVKYHVGKKNDELEGILSDATKSLEDKAVLSRVRDVIKSCLSLDLLNKEVELYQMSMEQKIVGDVTKAVDKVGETFQLTQPERSAVLRALVEGGDLSRYGLMNAVTNSAESVGDYDRATEIETFGGRILDLPKRDWERIAEAA